MRAADLNPVFLSQSDSEIFELKKKKSEAIYFYGASIGSETRKMEFKRGGGKGNSSSFWLIERLFICQSFSPFS